MLVLRNVRMVPSNMRKKNKGAIKCEMWQNTVTCKVSAAQYEDGTIKCEKKIKEPPYVAKYSHL